ncbi:MAG TPA: response regulator [Acidimicrobiales bacterium]|nr:response regulator [Acidimicrobiales bacterium]
MSVRPAVSSPADCLPAAPNRILLAEDDLDVGRYLEISLGVEGFEIVRATDGRSAVATAVAQPPDLVVLDIGMPGMDGVAVCQELRRDPRTSAVPIIILTARIQKTDKLLGLEAGADDYVTKPFDPAELVARIRGALRRTRQLRDVSPLTGLPGNIAIFRQLEHLLSGAGPDFALLHADLDNFKAFNDHYGFAAGDGVIRATASLLTSSLEDLPDTPRFAGHVGGDDFVLVTPAPDAERLADRIIPTFDDMIAQHYEGADVRQGHISVASRRGGTREFPLMTISIGIVKSTPCRFRAPAEMASVASDMKNVAKEMGGSSWCLDRRAAPPPRAAPGT